MSKDCPDYPVTTLHYIGRPETRRKFSVHFYHQRILIDLTWNLDNWKEIKARSWRE